MLCLMNLCHATAPKPTKHTVRTEGLTTTQNRGTLFFTSRQSSLVSSNDIIDFLFLNHGAHRVTEKELENGDRLITLKKHS